MTIVVSSSNTSGTLPLMRGKIQDRGFGSDTVEAQNELLNSVYRRVIGLRRWEWLESQDTAIVTVAGTAAYSITTEIPDLLHLDAVRLHQGIERLAFDYVEHQKLREYEHWDTVTGTPIYWAQTANEIRVYPTPDGVYTLTVDYVKDPDDLVDEGDQSLLPQAYEDILVWGAISELCFRERNTEGYSTAQNEYNGRLREMTTEYGIRQRQSSSQVGHWPGWG